MNLNTHPENRKDMVKAISELTELPSAYMGMRIEQKFWNISETCQSTSRCL